MISKFTFILMVERINRTISRARHGTDNLDDEGKGNKPALEIFHLKGHMKV